MAGSGVDAGSFSGGRALTGESLQGNAVDYMNAVSMPVPYEELRRVMDTVLAGVYSGRFVSYNDVVQFIIAQGYGDSVAIELIKFLSQKLPEIQ
jgi:hypothetical protein